jgi:hypothetical protein
MGEVHLLPVHDVGGEPAWMLDVSCGCRHKIAAATRVEAYARRYERDLQAWRIDHGHERVVVASLRTQAWCHGCRAGRPCAAWRLDALEAEGYRLRAPSDRRWSPPRPNPTTGLAAHADALGIDKPYTAAKIQDAFRRKIAQAHPDHGGSAAATRRVVAARDALIAAGSEAGMAPRATRRRTAPAHRSGPRRRAALRRARTRRNPRPEGIVEVVDHEDGTRRPPTSLLWIDVAREHTHDHGELNAPASWIELRYGPGRMYRHAWFGRGLAYWDGYEARWKVGATREFHVPLDVTPSGYALDDDPEVSADRLRQIGAAGYLLLQQMLARLDELRAATPRRRRAAPRT